MGMASTQARLLTLTNRKNAIGYDLTMLSSQKMALARESDKISDDYNAALNEKRLKWSNDSGATMYDLTYDTLMQPGQLNNYEPYMVTDMSGRVVVDDNYLKYAQMISPTGASGGSYDACRSKILADLMGVDEGTFLKEDEYNTNLTDLQNTIYNLEKNEPPISTKVATEALYAAGKVPSKAVTASNSVGENTAVTADTSWGEIISSLGATNYVTYLSWDGDSSSANKKFTEIVDSFADTLGSLVFDSSVDKKEGFVEFSDENLKAAKDATVKLFTKKYEYDYSSNHDRRERAGGNADDYNTIAHVRDEDAGVFDDGPYDSYAVSLSNMVNVFLSYLLGDEATKQKITNQEVRKASDLPTISLGEYTLTDEKTQREHDEWQNLLDGYKNDLATLTDNWSDPFDAEAEKKIDFYDAIFRAIETSGWTHNENMNDVDYMNDILQTGLYNITKAEKANDGSWTYDESAPTTAQNIYQVTDSNEINKATALYENEKRKINNKEEAIDTRMQKLETEQSSINQMLEAYRSMIDNNVENTFDTFG